MALTAPDECTMPPPMPLRSAQPPAHRARTSRDTIAGCLVAIALVCALCAALPPFLPTAPHAAYADPSGGGAAAEDAAAASLPGADATVNLMPSLDFPSCQTHCVVPANVTIREGGSVTFVNRQNMDREQIASGDPVGGEDGAFRTPVLRPGENYTVVLKEPGVYPYFGIFTPLASGTITVVASDEDLPPTADAGPDIRVDGGDTVTLSGMSHDPEGRPLELSWRQIDGPAVDLSDPEQQGGVAVMAPSPKSEGFTMPYRPGKAVPSGSATFVAPYLVDSATLVFEFAAEDPASQAATDHVFVKVRGAPDGDYERRDIHAELSEAFGHLSRNIGSIPWVGMGVDEQTNRLSVILYWECERDTEYYRSKIHEAAGGAPVGLSYGSYLEHDVRVITPRDGGEDLAGTRPGKAARELAQSASRDGGEEPAGLGTDVCIPDGHAATHPDRPGPPDGGTRYGGQAVRDTGAAPGTASILP